MYPYKKRNVLDRFVRVETIEIYYLRLDAAFRCLCLEDHRIYNLESYRIIRRQQFLQGQFKNLS